jgi:hypothetical protein
MKVFMWGEGKTKRKQALIIKSEQGGEWQK